MIGLGRSRPRSFLFVPADRAASLLPKAVRSGAHALIVDLEDGIIPAHRAGARRDLAAAIATIPPEKRSVPIFMRVNPASSREFEADIDAGASLPIAGIVLPKCSGAHDVAHALAVWSAASTRPVAVLAMVESALGVLEASAIARADRAVLGLILGAEDLAAETGMRRTPRGDELLFARSMLVLAATAAGCWAIDTPSMELDDLAAVRQDARVAAHLGFTAKLAVHPRQVAEIHAAFRPPDEDRETAARIIDAADRAQADGFGVLAHRGRMVDRPVVEAARQLLEASMRDEGGGDDG